jgi:hypothetical protein
MPIPNVDTYHWDTVYVASFEVLNAAIKQSGSFPSQFDYTDSTGVVIKGVWADWALSLGGSGSLIQMQTTIASGTATWNALNLTGDLTGGIVPIQFNLEQVVFTGQTQPDPTAKPGTGTPKAQQFPQSNGSQVTVLTPTFPNLSPGALKDMLQAIFQNYFNAHLGDIKATFNVMIIGQTADTDGFQWLKPNAGSYAVGGPDRNKTLANTAFGALAMTDGGSIGPLQAQSVDISALVGLADGANSSLVISPEKVTRHMLLKGAVTTIQGSKETDFSISDSGLNIVTANDLTWGHFKLKNGSIISPKIKAGDFLMRMDGDHIHLEINNAAYSPSAGINVYLNLEQDFGFQTVKREDGKFVFIPDLKSFGKAKIHSNVQVAEWLKITEIVLGVVGGIAALAGGISAVADLLAAGADAVVSTSTDLVVDITEDVVENAENSLTEDDWILINDTASKDVDAGIAQAGDSGWVQAGNFLKSNQFRVFCGFSAALAGIPAAAMGIATAATSQNYNDIPPFDDFAANVLGASQFPVLTKYELLGAKLRNSLVASIKLS